MDAMVDLTGGLAERFDMEDVPDKRWLFRLLRTASRSGAFITASRKVGDGRLGAGRGRGAKNIVLKAVEIGGRGCGLG